MKSTLMVDLADLAARWGAIALASLAHPLGTSSNSLWTNLIAAILSFEAAGIAIESISSGRLTWRPRAGSALVTTDRRAAVVGVVVGLASWMALSTVAPPGPIHSAEWADATTAWALEVTGSVFAGLASMVVVASRQELRNR
jgi:hypothetical protein